jgi:4-hydroxy-tetrahydrodipicolinate reductase
MLKVIFNGASGRMGSALVPLLQQASNIDLVALTNKNDDLGATIQSTAANCVIDFTVPNAAYQNTKIIIQNNARPIIGTSGLSDTEVDSIRSMCAEKKLGGLIVPNFCISAILMQQFAAKAAPWFTHAEIIERHHKQKLDAPSGTAIATAKTIAAHNKALADDNNKFAIAIESQRLDNIFAEQDVIFNSAAESLRIAQKSTARSCMLPGVLLACDKIMQLTKLEIGLAQFLL